MANEKHYVPYGLRDIWFGEYSYSNGAISYANQQVLGRGITATFDLKFAEGRLYSSGALSRYKKKLTGGSISLNVEDLPQSIQKSIFAATEYSRNVGSGSSTAVKSIGYNRNSGFRSSSGSRTKTIKETKTTVLVCPTCEGAKFVLCPECNGRKAHPCKKCNGLGIKKKGGGF